MFTVRSQTERQRERVSKLVFYAQSTGTVISERERERERERDRQTDRQTELNPYL